MTSRADGVPRGNCPRTVDGRQHPVRAEQVALGAALRWEHHPQPPWGRETRVSEATHGAVGGLVSCGSFMKISP